MTYGEAWTKFKFDVNGWEFPFDEVPGVAEHEKKMKKEEAAKYYTEKINNYFKEKGYRK